MAKKGMKRPERTHTQPRNNQTAVPELQGNARSGKEKARPVISGTEGGEVKVFHTARPSWSDPYPPEFTDLARDNLDNDTPAADLEDI